MPCYEPPRPDEHDVAELARQRDKHVETLKDIEGYCALFPWSSIAQEVMGIIDKHWKKTP